MYILLSLPRCLQAIQALLVSASLLTGSLLAQGTPASTLRWRERKNSAELALAPGGPYGLVQQPYMGWRSWNAYHNGVTQALMEEVMEKIVAKQPDGSSLRELGYIGVGLDDNWQACRQGLNGSFHTASGQPLWNRETFPHPEHMVAKAHKLALKAGWCAWHASTRLLARADFW